MDAKAVAVSRMREGVAVRLRRKPAAAAGAPLDQLAKRIAGRTAHIGILGLGYVGLPLAVEFAKAGFQVTGIDPDIERVEGVNHGRSYILDVANEELRKLHVSERLHATSSFDALGEQDAVIICVPTPLRKTREPDMSYILSATQEIAQRVRRGQLIVLESTTYPGTTDEVILPALEASGLKVGRDFCLAFSPERIDPGNPTYTTRTIPKVIGGITPQCTKLATALYRCAIEQTVPVSCSKVAEMVKLLENTFRAVNIGLVNEIALICSRLGIDVWEVIEAAKTKPFGFLPFYPGPGIGGHCLDGNEVLVVKRGDQIDVLTFEELARQLTAERCHRTVHRQGATFIRPQSVDVLSFDLERRYVSFQPLTWLVARPYQGRMVHLRTGDGRQLTVTDLHPMVVQAGSLNVKWARDLTPDDEPVVMNTMPDGCSDAAVDLIEHFSHDSHYVGRIRVIPRGFSWTSYRRWLRPILKKYRKDPWEYYRRNGIPLAAYLEARRLPTFPSIDHRQLLLSCGQGPSWTTCPAVLELDESMCRLVGYYLSEGCLSEDTSLCVRFSFNRNEDAYIRDVQDIVSARGLRYSVYDSKQWQTRHIKVSSLLFGVFLRDCLGCGTNSYTMRVPKQIFGLSHRHRAALLSGILRGDGGVDVKNGQYTFTKRGKRYTSRGNWASLNYYSISRPLFQQVVLLLQGFGIMPTFKRRANYLTVFGEPQLRRCAEWLDGDKRQRLLQYFAGRVKRMPNKTFRVQSGYATVRLKELTHVNGTRMVYSAEVDKTHTFVTSYGLVVHNCIPSDPMYLAWKVRVHGFEARFIELATQINSAMPEYVVERVGSILNDRRRALKGSRIVLLGLAYKKDVSDVRDSPAFDVARLLKERGAHVDYHDPYVPSTLLNGARRTSVPLTAQTLRRADCVVLLTNHSTVDYAFVLRHAPVIFDTRNQYRGLSRSSRVVRL